VLAAFEWHLIAGKDCMARKNFVPFALAPLLVLAASCGAIAEPAMSPVFKESEEVVKVVHVTLRSKKNFELVRAGLERNVPKLSSEIQALLLSGDTEQLKLKLEQGPELSIFLIRDHGRLLETAGLERKAIQYEIGNPLTASKMTRHNLAAGLYAPLRVVLYEDQSGESVFEYDKPSSLFGQFDDSHVTEVALGLDAALERALRAALN
jgi:uncharacterized protein (DUF302 family)